MSREVVPVIEDEDLESASVAELIASHRDLARRHEHLKANFRNIKRHVKQLVQGIETRNASITACQRLH